MKARRSKPRFTEAELVAVVEACLTQEGYRVEKEVPTLGQSADIVARRGDSIICIEAKLKDWRRALQQCQVHTLVADFICVAIASTSVSESLLTAVEARGFGLLQFCWKSNSLKWICHPVENTHIWQPQRQLWLQGFKP